MAITSNLEIPLIEEAQSQKYVTHNDAIVKLEDFLTRTLACDLSLADRTVSPAEAQAYRKYLCTNVTASREIELPSPPEREYEVESALTNSFVLRAESTGNNQVRLVPGEVASIWAGLAAEDFRLLRTNRTPFERFVVGTPTVSSTVAGWIAQRRHFLRAGAIECAALCGTAPFATTTFTIRQNGTAVGTFAFAASATTATFTVGSDVTLVPGDSLTVTAQTLTLNGIANVSMYLAFVALR